MTLYEIPLQQSPSQEVSFIVDNTEINIRLKTLNNSKMYIDVDYNNENVFKGFEALNEYNFFQNFKYLNLNNSLFFVTKSGENPKWDKLNTEDKLYYATI